MMSNTLLESVVKKNRARLIPFMLALYVLAFLDRSNIGFAKETYQLDTGLSNEAYALGAGIFFVVYAFLGVPANLLMRKFGARRWIGCTTLLWGVLSAAMAWADTEAKFLLVRTLLARVVRRAPAVNHPERQPAPAATVPRPSVPHSCRSAPGSRLRGGCSSPARRARAPPFPYG